MAGDADVIRCAVPWPGIAAQLLEGLASLGGGAWSVDQLCAAAAAGLHPGDATAVLADLAAAGVCIASNDGADWGSPLAAAELLRLAQMLRGADHFRRLRTDASSSEFVVTLPMAPSRLAEELTSSAGRPGGYLSTPDAFVRLAQAASQRLVIMTPFIDGRGFEWLRTVLTAVRPGVERYVILRDVEQHAVDLSVEHRDWLRDLNVRVLDYYLPHPRSSGRALPIETFHAKLVLADESLAYVGSANVLGLGEGTSLEAGILVDGRGAAQVARLVDGVLRIARRL